MYATFRCKICDMGSFKSLVIFDLETTGLPRQEHNCTKITEMSFVGCLVTHLQEEELPRVINSLTLALNPMKKILPQASEVNGLHNELLEDMKPFDDDVVILINKFLVRMPQPVCLIAHNGLTFDFPILRRQLNFCKIKLMDEIWCADSLPAFQSFLPKARKQKKQSFFNGGFSKLPEQSLQPPNFSMSLCETTPNIKTVPHNITPIKESVQCHILRENIGVVRKLDFDSDKRFEMEEIISMHPRNKQYNNDCDITYNFISEMQSKILQSYKLSDIYNFLHDSEVENFHTAGGDCMALLSCISKCKNKFFQWLPHNSKLLNEIPPLI